MARTRLRARGGPRGAAPPAGAATTRERALRPARPVRLSAPQGRPDRRLPAALPVGADQLAPTGGALGAGAPGLRRRAARGRAAAAPGEAEAPRARPPLRGRGAAA